MPVCAADWSRMTRNGAIAGILMGGVTVVVWKQLDGGLFDLYEIIPGFLLSLLSIWLVSRADISGHEAVTASFNRVERRILAGRQDP